MPKKVSVPTKSDDHPTEQIDEDYETVLRRTIVRLKEAVFDPDTPPRDLAALTRRLMEFERELTRLREEDSNGPADIEEGMDDIDFDPEDI